MPWVENKDDEHQVRAVKTVALNTGEISLAFRNFLKLKAKFRCDHRTPRLS